LRTLDWVFSGTFGKRNENLVHRNREYKKSYYGNIFIYMYEFKKYAEKIHFGFD